jgi:hypothetical protein
MDCHSNPLSSPQLLHSLDGILVLCTKHDEIKLFRYWKRVHVVSKFEIQKGFSETWLVYDGIEACRRVSPDFLFSVEDISPEVISQRAHG